MECGLVPCLCAPTPDVIPAERAEEHHKAEAEAPAKQAGGTHESVRYCPACEAEFDQLTAPEFCPAWTSPDRCWQLRSGNCGVAAEIGPHAAWIWRDPGRPQAPNEAARGEAVAQ